MKPKNEGVKLSRSTIERTAHFFLGPKARVWKNKDGTYQIGRELNPGREILGTGNNLAEAFVDAFTEPPSEVGPPLTDANDNAQKPEDAP